MHRPYLIGLPCEVPGTRGNVGKCWLSLLINQGEGFTSLRRIQGETWLFSLLGFSSTVVLLLFSFKSSLEDILIDFRERGRERKPERERNIVQLLPVQAPTGNIHRYVPDGGLNTQPFGAMG